MRILWVLLMIAGTLFFAGLAIVMVAGIPIGGGYVITSRGVWPIISVLAAGACAAGIFMKPREFKEAVTPPEPPRAAWLDELGKSERQD